MLQLRNRAGFDVAAVIPAGAGLFPFFRLCGRLRSGPFVPVVARGRNYAVAGTEDFVADLAVKRKLPGSRSGTGRSRFDFSFLPGLFGSMAERSEDGILQIDLTFPCRIGEVQSAAAAGPICSISRFGARCGFGIGADQGMGMLEHGNHAGLHVLPVMSANAPLLAFLSLAGRFHHDPLAPVVTERFNPFVTGAEDFSAHPAVQFKALIARFRAGRFPGGPGVVPIAFGCVACRWQNDVAVLDFLCSRRVSEYFATAAAGPEVDIPCFGTLRLNRSRLRHIVPVLQSGNYTGFSVPAVMSTGTRLHTRLIFCSFLCRHPLAPVMANGRDHAVTGTEGLIAS